MFEGNKCPYCGKTFTSVDDIAVCPDCGTPHHRSCYKEHNHCANEDKHGSFTWIPDNSMLNNQSKQGNTENIPTDIVCPTCGQTNSITSKYCSRCGNVLNNSFNNSIAPLYSKPRVIEIQQISTEEKIDGIPIKDWLVFLGPTAVSLVRTFLKQNNTGSKWGFSIGAFFFPVLFYLYYKVWGVAALIVITDIICNAPTILLQFNYPIASLIGMTQSAFSTLANVLSYSYLAIIFILSLFSKSIVRKSASETIKKIRRSCTNENEYSVLLNKKSCPNKYVVGTLLVIYILSFLFLIFT